MGVKRKDGKEGKWNERVEKSKVGEKRKSLFTLEVKSCRLIFLSATSSSLHLSLMSYWPCLTQEENLHLSNKLAP